MRNVKVWLFVAAFAVAALLVVVIALPIFGSAMIIGGLDKDDDEATSSCQPVTAQINTDPDATSGKTIDDLAADWKANAETIVGVAQQRGLSTQAAVIALATAMQESRLGNINYGDRDSLGLFQQRASWGTAEQRTTPAWAAGKFYDSLVQVAGWESMPVTVAAQRVQRSAFPGAYASWESLARSIVGDKGSVTPINASAATSACDAATDASVAVAPGTWVRPNAGPWLSKFGMRVNPVSGVYKLHAGIDLSGRCGSPILAATSGTVTKAGPASGYGNLIIIDIGGGADTRFGHMKASDILVQPGQAVQAGQQIARVGSEGDSTGCHLHFEVRQNGAATDPAPILQAHGVPLEFRK